VPALEAEGWKVRPFDLARRTDLRDEKAVYRAVRGCDAIVHAGAIPNDAAGSPADIVATNVLGTWHVLLGAEAHQVSRVIYFSSIHVFGFWGEDEPAYLPVDDGMSKRLSEEMCEAWTARTGIPTVALRPVWILGDEDLEHITREQSELGAFVHIDDVVAAVVKALSADVHGHSRLILSGAGPFDTSTAEHTLGWRATRSWTH
jgi:nucleoside-diphosphate-sugar epimerase